MNIHSLLALLLALALQSCASTPSDKPAETVKTDDPRACMTNFSTDGSFLAGRQFRTFEDFPRKTQSGAFDSLVPAVSAGGYQILNASKELSIISAANPVSYSRSAQSAPLNLSVQKNTPAGVRVQITFSITGGMATSTEAIQKEFCRMLAAVNQSADEPIAVIPEAPKQKAAVASPSSTPAPGKIAAKPAASSKKAK